MDGPMSEPRSVHHAAALLSDHLVPLVHHIKDFFSHADLLAFEHKPGKLANDPNASCHVFGKYPRATSSNSFTCFSSHILSRFISSAIHCATRGAMAMLARASRKSARVRRARISSTVRAMVLRVSQMTC